MRKILVAVLSAFCIISCDRTQTVQKIKLEDLPEALQPIEEIFISNYEEDYFYQSAKITIGRKVFYIVDLTSADCIVTDKKGNWILVYGTSKRYRGVDIPKIFIPEPVREYMASEAKWVMKRKNGGYVVYDHHTIMTFDKKLDHTSNIDFEGQSEEWLKNELGFDPFVMF